MSNTTARQVGEGIGTAAGMAIGAMRAAQHSALTHKIEQATKAVDEGRLDAAIVTAKALLQEKDRDAQAVGHYVSAMVHVKEGDNAKAITHFSACIQLMESSNAVQDYPHQLAGMYFARGSLYLEQDELANALRDLTAAIRLTPQEGELYFLRGRALRRLGDLSQALSDLNQAISQAPDDADYYRERSQVYIDLKEPQQSLADLERALKLKPTNSRTLRDRGKLYALMGEHEKAIEDYTEAIRLDPDNADLFDLRAESYQSTGKIDSAEADSALAARKKGARHKYGEYLEAARKFHYEQGGARYTRAEAEGRTSYVSSYVGAIVGMAFIGLVLGWFIAMVVGGGRSFNVSIVFWVVVGLVVFGILTTRSEASKRRQRATAYWAALDRLDRQKPGFAEFFDRYVDARAAGKLDDRLFNSTRRILEGSKLS